MSRPLTLPLLLASALALPAGIAWGADGDAIDFEKQIAPIFEDKCINCHSGDKPKGNYSMVTKEETFGDGLIVLGDPDDGDFYWLLITDDEDEMMPPPENGGPLPDDQKELVRRCPVYGRSSSNRRG